MKCPKCEFDNKQTAKFCKKCGARLEQACPSCGQPYYPDSVFCEECGYDLAAAASKPTPPVELSFEEKLDKIQRYLPGGLTEKILSRRGKIEGERKQVTVMFCNAEGFSLLAERLGPEKVYALMDDVFETLIHKVHEYGGTVNKMTGDGVMALFGAPIALEDAPQRAIRSALAIQRDISRLSDRKKEETGNRPIRMRIGVHTGPVVVGSLGNDLRVEFTAVGDTVNLASRMEGLAEPGTVYVTEDTFKLTEGLFRFEALGERQVKGKEAPVKAYRVIAPSTRRTRFDVSAERGLTPFLGRERELELLVDGLDRAKSGRGQAFSIMGEAGVGKSRLLYEFRKAVGSRDVTFLEGRCLSYSTNAAYHPFIDLLKSAFDIGESDDDEAIRTKFKADLKELGADEVSTLPYMLELLSVEDSGIDAISMSPEARRDRIMDALKRIVLGSSQIRPLVIAIEDLHWVDRSSEDTLKVLLDGISGARVMLVFTYRPDYVHAWGGKSYHSQVTLNRLSNREALAMAAHLLGTEEIGSDLEELILEKTEGIPFFVEEFVRSLKDLGVIQWKDSGYYLAGDIAQMAIPGTIQDVIMARVDSLPEAAKNVLQTGSVIEREFSHELIKRVTGIPEKELLSHLSVLRDSELLYERGIFPESSYVFKHSLTREVVYDSILSARTKRLHIEIGDVIESLHSESIEEQCQALAGHYIEGEDWEKGAAYCKVAEKKAGKAGSPLDRITYAEKRIACLERLPQTEDVQRRIVDARTTLGLYYLEMNYFVEARKSVEPTLDVASKGGYKSRLSQIYTIMGCYAYMIEEDTPRALEYLQDARVIAEEMEDALSLFAANFWLGQGLAVTCKFESALHHFEKALEITFRANNVWGTAGTTSVMSIFVLDLWGKTRRGYQTTAEALRVAEDCGDVYAKALSYVGHGYSSYCQGYMKEAEGHLLKGIEISASIGFHTFTLLGHIWLSETYFDMGEYRKCKACLQRGVAQEPQLVRLPSWISLLKIGVARAKAMNDEMDIDLTAISKCHENNGVECLDGWMSRYIGQMLLTMGQDRVSDAENWITRAIEADTRNGMRWHLARDHAAYADLFKRKGDIPKARKELAKAIDIFKECGADGWVTMTEEKLKALA